MRWLRWLRWILVSVAVLVLAAFGAAWWALDRSLPTIDGNFPEAGLSAEASIERDARGIPVITGRTRADVAFATGFAHSQDRFFQIPVVRWRRRRTRFPVRPRRAGYVVRRFGFRAVARRVIETAPADERAVSEAHARGANAGSPASRRDPGNTCCCAPTRGRGRRKIRCWWCIRCGGSCSTAR
jgi:penicillin amidase